MEYPFKDLLPLDEVLEREGYYKDWTHLNPEVFYSLTQISEYIKTKGYGVDVRLLISQLAEHFGLKSTQIIDLANLLQQKFENLEGVTQSFTNNINSLVQQMEADKNAVIANATVDSEVILARGGKATLGQRLDETEAQLAQTTDKVGVSFEEFGATLDGITDDTEAIKATFAYANEHQIPVIQRYSAFILNDEVEVRTDVDLKGSIVKTTIQDSAQYEYNRTSYLFKIVGEPLENITPSLQRHEFTKGNTRIPSLANTESGTLIIQTQDFDMNRVLGNIVSPMTKEEVNMVIKNPYGDLAYPLTKDFSNSLGFTVHHRKNEPKLTFIAPNVDVNNANIYSIVRVERNNVDVMEGSILDTRGGTISPVHTFTHFYKCSQVKTDGLNVPLIGREQKTGENGLGYVLLYDFVADIQIRNSYQVSGWSGINGNNFRDIYVENSKLLSISGHANTYDLRIGANTTSYNGVLAHGGGVLEVDGLTIVNGRRPFVDTPDMTTGQLSNIALGTRDDYGGEWDGVIKIKDLTTIHPTVIVHLSRVVDNVGRKSILPRVEVDKLTIVNPLGNTTIAVRWDGMNNNPVDLPSFDIKNVKVLSKSRHRTLTIPDITVPVGDTPSEGGTIHAEIENCNPPLESFIHDLMDVENANIRLPHIKNDNFRIKMKVRNSVFNVEFRSSSNMDIDVFESEVYALRVRTGDDLTLNGYKSNVNLINCTIHKPVTNLNGYENKDRFNFTVKNSVWKRYELDTVSPDLLGGSMADLIRFSSNNIAENFEGVLFTHRAKMFDYIDPNHWVNS